MNRRPLHSQGILVHCYTVATHIHLWTLRHTGYLQIKWPLIWKSVKDRISLHSSCLDQYITSRCSEWRSSRICWMAEELEMKMTNTKESSFCTWQAESSRLWFVHRGVISEWPSSQSSGGRWELRQESSGLSGSSCGAGSAAAKPSSSLGEGLLSFTSLSANLASTSQVPLAVSVRPGESSDVIVDEETLGSEVMLESSRSSHSRLSTVLGEEARELGVCSVALEEEPWTLVFLLNRLGVGSGFPNC